MNIYNLPEHNFINLHYLNRYVKLIQWSSKQNFEGYTEKHHILPKSMGGDNSKENLIRISARIHFLAHYLLYKIYGGKMTYAFSLMKANPNKNSNRYFKLTSKQYEMLKINTGITQSKNQKGKKRTKKQIENIILGCKNGKKHNYSEEEKLKRYGHNKNRKFINNGIITKRVSFNEFDQLISLGNWFPGNLTKNFNNKNSIKIQYNNLIFDSKLACAKYYNHSTDWVEWRIKSGEAILL